MCLDCTGHQVGKKGCATVLCVPPQQEEATESGNGPPSRGEDRTSSDIQLRSSGPIQPTDLQRHGKQEGNS